MVSYKLIPPCHTVRVPLGGVPPTLGTTGLTDHLHAPTETYIYNTLQGEPKKKNRATYSYHEFIDVYTNRFNINNNPVPCLLCVSAQGEGSVPESGH